MKLDETDPNVVHKRTEVTNMACQTTEQTKAGLPTAIENTEGRKSPKEVAKKNATKPAEEVAKSVNKSQTDNTMGKKKPPQEWPLQKEADNKDQSPRVKPFERGGECNTTSDSVTNRKPLPSDNEVDGALSKALRTKLHLSDDMDKEVDTIINKTEKLEIKPREPESSDTENKIKSREPSDFVRRLTPRQPPGLHVGLRLNEGIPNIETTTDQAFMLFQNERKRGLERDPPVFVKGLKVPVENSDITPFPDDELVNELIFTTPPHEPYLDISAYATGYQNGYGESPQWDNYAARPVHMPCCYGQAAPPYEQPKPDVGVKSERYPCIDHHIAAPRYSVTPNQHYPVTGGTDFYYNGMQQSGTTFMGTPQTDVSKSSRSTGVPDVIRSHDRRFHSVDSSPASAYGVDSSPAPSPGSESTLTTYSATSPAGTTYSATSPAGTTYNATSPARTPAYPNSPDSAYSRESESVHSPDSGYGQTVPSPEWRSVNESSTSLYEDNAYSPAQADVKVKGVSDYINAGYSPAQADVTKKKKVPTATLR